MIVTLHTQGLQTLAQVRAFVAGSEAVTFTIAGRSTACAWVADTLKLFHYECQSTSNSFHPSTPKIFQVNV